MDYYTLINRVTSQVSLLDHVFNRISTEARCVGDTLVGDVRVSTVFEGVDRSIIDDGGRVMLFESVTFGLSPLIQLQSFTKSATWGGAELMHAEVCEEVRILNHKNRRGCKKYRG